MSLTTQLKRVALAGNPNTGKTTLFNQLTGSRSKVGNYPGVTVDRHVATLELGGSGRVELMDVPGTYSLAARSEEERVAVRAIAGLDPLQLPEAVIVVVDASRLVRNLYLVLQIIELGLPTVVALNMSDQVETQGLRLDPDALERELGVPVVPTVALKGEGCDKLLGVLDRVLQEPASARPGWRWRIDEPKLRADVDAVGAALPEDWYEGDANRRDALAVWALLSLDGDDELEDVDTGLRRAVEERRRDADADGREIEEEVIRGRYAWLDERADRFLLPLTKAEPKRVSVTDRVDGVLLNPALGFLLFLGAMMVVFQSLFAWADPAIGWIETAVGWFGGVVGSAVPEGFLQGFLVDGVIAGVGGVLVFLPQILLLFFFIGLMEDTGYMARVAYLMDRVMRMLGLHGRAFVPMLSGFACAIPAILATRTMERKRDRMLTMMVVPLMTCSARLPVYGLLIAALYPPNEQETFVQGLLMVGMYLFSTLVALVAAAVLGRTMLKGPRVPLLLEMPPYRMPHLRSVVRMMWERSAVFLREAGTVILVCTIAMWLLLTFPSDGEITAQYEGQREDARAAQVDPDALEGRLAEIDQEEAGAQLRASYGGKLGQAIEPTIEPLGFDWKIGIGLIGAFAAREVFVSTMAVVYGLSDEEDETSTALRDQVRAQTWPDGSRVYTPLVCLSLMVFFALACQCMSTVAAVKRETATYRWPVFLFVYMTALAWFASFAVYQGGRLLGFE